MKEKSIHSKKAGAIIRIIYYILRRDDKIKDYFDSSYISNRYNGFLKYPLHRDSIKRVIKEFKKHGCKNRIKTLEEKTLLQQWLDKHTNIKPIFWFNKLNGRFILKKNI